MYLFSSLFSYIRYRWYMAEMIVIHPSTLTKLDCRLHYHWSRNYKSRRSAPALEFGIAVHHALEQYYGSNVDPAKAFASYVDANTVSLEGLSNARDLGTAMLQNYVETYKDKEKFTIFYTEKEIARRIPIPADDPNPPARAKRFYVAARIDAVVWDRVLGRMFVLEHKTFEKFYPGSLELDHQFVIEKFVAEGITTSKVDGVIYNGLRKRAEPSSTTKLFERHYLYINDAQVKVALHRAYWSLIMVTSDDFVVYPEPSPMKCNFCEFKQPCSEYTRGGDYQFLLDNLFEHRSEDEEDSEWE